MAVSYVTDVVFIAHHRKDVDRFAELVAAFYKRRYGSDLEVTPMECDGPNFTWCELFYLGLDYADGALIDTLKSEPWVGHTVLWIESESYANPNIQVNGETVMKAILEGSQYLS